jgi:hypothetical protein
MGKHYFSWEEDQAYKEGYRDSERNRRDYYHDKYSMDGVDRAYFDGRKDQEREEERREEEHQEEERMERRAQEHREEQRRREEEYEIYLQNQIEDQMRAERQFNEAMARGQIHPDFIAPEYDVEPLVDELQPDEMSPNDYEELASTPSTEQELFMQIQEEEREESCNKD